MKNIFFLLLLFMGSRQLFGQAIDTSPDRVWTPLRIDFEKIGTIKPRSTHEIKSSRITVGCETIDRDLVIWDNYKGYLAPLGVKKIRLQAGWAKCEKVKGEYDWEWLDEIIDYAVANNLEPWLQPSYGNPIYEGGGGKGLLNSLMTSQEAYEAWDRWVAALVTRYQDRVTEWEIWNEPDHPMQEISPETTAQLNIRTAEIIKSIQPDAEIAGLAFASNSDKEYLDRFLKVISDEGKLDLFHWISYHSYTMRPEDAYSDNRVFGLKKVIDQYDSTLLLRQGENGAPSTYIPSFALSEYYWTEYTQAKYNMRRLLGDLGNNVETSVFTIIDIYCKPVLNTKGLIQSDITQAAVRPKVAYYAVQNLASIFDDELVLQPDAAYVSKSDFEMSVYCYWDSENETPLVALWMDGQEVTNSFETQKADLSFPGLEFTEPVWVDLITGKVFEIDASSWSKTESGTNFQIPLYDSPVLIAEKSGINLQ
ncbi:beta-galactosidase [Algoriphagus aestuariicola]|uniref:Beta-galactosidase n=1 Tax=Algoriphagus aestuariicola TaxID=1852016 RepID=A0ABS3BQW4_9BACT|nr:beta-galactosidase [Algoriphagus aestuariicola]MBN7800069.1 beta-galactosidase [Algoriphagus aestuariicola]